jgi:ribonuclease PH
MREVTFERGYIDHPAGSCLACFGRTRVICTASVQADVPRFLVGTGRGWITAEYAMLPGSTSGGRKPRDLLKRDSRNVEISRLIGRSLRAAVDLARLGEITIVIDCDVLQADGGTRTAAISGGWVALCDALRTLPAPVERAEGADGVTGGAPAGPRGFLLGQVAAVSVGLVDGRVVCDLDYGEDSAASVDMNVVQRDGALVEVQGTAERGVFDRAQLAAMLDAADAGIREIYRAQRAALAP